MNHAQDLPVGTCVILQHTHTPFYVVESGDAPSEQFILSRGMQPITKRYKCVSENLHVVPDANEFSVKQILEDRAKSPEEVHAMVEEAERKSLEYRDKCARDRDEAGKRAIAFREEAMRIMPAGTKAVIVATHKVDESDPYTDYRGSRTTDTIILAWSPHTRDLFAEMRKASLNAPETKHLFDAPEDAEHREKYSMGAGYYLKTGWRDSTGWDVHKVSLVYRKETTPDISRIPVGRWSLPSVTTAAASPVTTSGATIEQHTHTKKGFEMFLVILSNRVERDVFDDLREKAQAMGGWWSRPWGKTPGGFAFTDLDVAQSFISMYVDHQESSPVSESMNTPKVAASTNVATKLREIADKMQDAIDDKFRDRLENTAKRLGQARSAQLEGRRLQRTQVVLRNLADLHDIGQVPPLLAKIKTKAAVYDCMGAKTQQVNNGYHYYQSDSNEPRNKDELTLALWGLIDGAGPDPKQQELQRLVDGLKFSNIPGYFPTPDLVVEQMLGYACIRDGMAVLEPSAGHGAIADAVKECGEDIHVFTFEANHTLANILKLKGYSGEHADFIQASPVQVYDRVVANPPFENLQDIDHVLHAFRFLKRGGRLVSIMSPSAFFHSSKKAQQFREWFDVVGGEKISLPDGSFKASGTGVSTVMIVVDKE